VTLWQYLLNLDSNDLRNACNGKIDKVFKSKNPKRFI
jgi:signal transduction histidine kinase